MEVNGQEAVPHWEDALNRWLDGDLSEEEFAALKRQSVTDEALASALVEAGALRQYLAELPSDPAPAALRRKLLAIPQTAQPRWRDVFSWPRWQVALAVLPMLAVGLLWLPADAPSQAEIHRGQEQLALALVYLERASTRASGEVGASINRGMARPVLGAVTRSLENPLHTDREAEL